MATTMPSHDRARTRVPDGAVPVPRPGSPTAVVDALTQAAPAAVTAPPARTVVPVGAGWVAPSPVTPSRVALPRPRPDTSPSSGDATATALAEPPTRPVRTAPAGLAGLRRRSTATAGELATALVITTVGLLGAVFVLVTTATPTRPPVVTVVPAPSVSPNVSVPGRVLTSFGDGVWQVGVDIEPGTYAATGSVGGATCHHVLRPTRAGGNVTPTTAPAGAAAVVLTADDGWFETSGCATWTRTD